MSFIRNMREYGEGVGMAMALAGLIVLIMVGTWLFKRKQDMQLSRRRRDGATFVRTPPAMRMKNYM